MLELYVWSNWNADFWFRPQNTKRDKALLFSKSHLDPTLGKLKNLCLYSSKLDLKPRQRPLHLYKRSIPNALELYLWSNGNAGVRFRPQNTKRDKAILLSKSQFDPNPGKLYIHEWAIKHQADALSLKSRTLDTGILHNIKTKSLVLSTVTCKDNFTLPA